MIALNERTVPTLLWENVETSVTPHRTQVQSKRSNNKSLTSRRGHQGYITCVTYGHKCLPVCTVVRSSTAGVPSTSRWTCVHVLEIDVPRRRCMWQSLQVHV